MQDTNPLATTPAKPYNGKYTIASPTGHAEFRIKTQKETSTFFPGKRLVAVKDASELNQWGGASWRSFATVEADGSILQFRFRENENGAYVRLLTALLASDGDVTVGDKRYTMQVKRTCRICDRVLTRPDSIESGIGPECSGKGYAAGKRGRTSEVVVATASAGGAA